MTWPEVILDETIIPEGEPGETEGHAEEAHPELHRWFNKHTTLLVGPNGTEADIADALATANAHVAALAALVPPQRGTATVKLTGDEYDIAGLSNPALNIYMPRVHLDGGGATLNYAGNGVCLRNRMTPMTNETAGRVSDLTIDGTDAGDDAVGIEMGAIVRAKMIDVTSQNFSGLNAVGWDFHNPATGTWTERCLFIIDEANNTVGYRFRGTDVGGPSFLYNNFADMRFAGYDGQTVFQTLANAQLYDCILNLMGNLDDAVYVLDLWPTSMLRPSGHVTIEQTNGTGSALFAPGSSQPVYPKWRFQPNGFPDYDTSIVMPNFEGRGTDVIVDSVLGNVPQGPLHGLGLLIGVTEDPDDTVLGAYALSYDGGKGCGFPLLKVGFGQDFSDARSAARLDSVTFAEIGFRGGSLTAGQLATLAASLTADDTGLNLWCSDLAKPVWWNGTAFVAPTVAAI